MNNNADPAAIERDIRHTRARMDSTIDALKMKLSPGELLDQTLGYLKEGGADVGRSLTRRVRDNPLPLALMATSLAWLMISERRPHGSPANGAGRQRWDGAFEAGRPDEFSPDYSRRVFAEEPYRESEDLWPEDHEAIEHHDRLHEAIAGVRRRADETAEAFGERLYEAKATALDLRREAAEDIQAFMDRVDKAFHGLTERAVKARRKMADQAARLKDRASDAAQNAAAAVKHGAERAERYYDEHPLVVGALGVAAGALIGSLLPSTRAEDRRLGAAGAAIRARSAEVARDVATAAGETVDRVVERTAEAAKREGLTPENAKGAAGDLAERARRVGEEAIEAGRDEAERRLHKEETGEH